MQIERLCPSEAEGLRLSESLSNWWKIQDWLEGPPDG